MIVLGGGYVGMEFAQAFARFGSRVTILERGSQVLPREDKDVADALMEFLHLDGIEGRLNAEVAQVERSSGDSPVFRALDPGYKTLIPVKSAMVCDGALPGCYSARFENVLRAA